LLAIIRYAIAASIFLSSPCFADHAAKAKALGFAKIAEAKMFSDLHGVFIEAITEQGKSGDKIVDRIHWFETLIGKNSKTVYSLTTKVPPKLRMSVTSQETWMGTLSEDPGQDARNCDIQNEQYAAELQLNPTVLSSLRLFEKGSLQYKDRFLLLATTSGFCRSSLLNVIEHCPDKEVEFHEPSNISPLTRIDCVERIYGADGIVKIKKIKLWFDSSSRCSKSQLEEVVDGVERTWNWNCEYDNSTTSFIPSRMQRRLGDFSYDTYFRKPVRLEDNSLERFHLPFYGIAEVKNNFGSFINFWNLGMIAAGAFFLSVGFLLVRRDRK